MSMEDAGKSRDGWDLIVLPGGAEGATELRKSIVLMELLRRQNSDNKLYAAIGCSPAIVLATFEHLAPPGATCSPMVKFRAKMVEPSDYDIVIQNNLVTSQGAGSALLFALQLGEMLYCKDSADCVAQALLVDREGIMRYTYSRGAIETANEMESPMKNDKDKKLEFGMDILERLDQWRRVQAVQNVDQYARAANDHSRCRSPRDDTNPAPWKQKLDRKQTLKQQRTNIESDEETGAENSAVTNLNSFENVERIDDLQENVEPKATKDSQRNSRRKKGPVCYEEPLDVDSDDEFDKKPSAKNLKHCKQYLSGIVKTKSLSSKFQTKSHSNIKDYEAHTTTSLHCVLETPHCSRPMEMEIAELIAVKNRNEPTNWKKIKAKASQQLKALIEEKERMGLDHTHSPYTLLPKTRRIAIRALVCRIRKRRKAENSFLPKKSEAIKSAVVSTTSKIDTASTSLTYVGDQSDWKGGCRLQQKARLDSEIPFNTEAANVFPSHFRSKLTYEDHGKLPKSLTTDQNSDYTTSSNSSPTLGTSERYIVSRDIFRAVVWPVLENIGWRVEVGSRQCDKYFLPPGIAREGNKVRVDYFDAISQVLKQISEQKPWNETKAITLAIDLYSQKILHSRKRNKIEKKFRSPEQQGSHNRLNAQQKKRPNTNVELSPDEMADLLALHNKRAKVPRKSRKIPLVQISLCDDVHSSSEVFDVNEID